MLNNALILLILIPAGIAFINIFLPTQLKKTMTLISSFITLFLTIQIYRNPEVNIVFKQFPVLSIDSVALMALIFIQLLSLIILIFSLKGVEKSIESKFFILYPVTVASCTGVVISENAISFILFWGLAGLMLYLYGLLGTGKEAPRTAKKTFILIGGSDAFLLMGIAILLSARPDSLLSMAQLKVPLNCGLNYLAFFLLLIAAFAKAGGFPLHTWVPEFSKEAPIESAALLPASLDKLLGIYLLARMVTILFDVTFIFNLILLTLGAMTVIVAVMMAMIQHNGRKLLGYHAVSQVGYMIMGVGTGNAIGFVGGLFHLINHTIYKSNLFLTLGSVEKQVGSNDLEDMGGLGKKMPITFTFALIAALSISGIPPFNGFFSKWMIYQGVLERIRDLSPGYQLWLLTCLILAVFGSALTLASFMKFIHAIYLGKNPKALNKVHETSPNQWIATGILSALCIVFGLFAAQLPLKIIPSLNGAIEPSAYLGIYSPFMLFVLFGIAFIMGFVVYLLIKHVRYDDIYLGGMPALEKFRVLGTEFYNEIRQMTPLKALYDAAEKKVFDIYEIGSKSTVAVSRLFQKAHPGELQLYLVYIISGLLLIIYLLK